MQKRSVSVGELSGIAYNICRQASYGVNGFRSTGVYPLNKHAFTEADYIAAESDARHGPGVD